MALLQDTETGPIRIGEAQRGGAFSQWASRHAAILLLGLVLVFLPAIATHFILVQVVGWALILGIIALSLMFLAGYGGMVSLAQMTVAGVSGYMITVFGVSSLPAISLFWPWWVAAPIAIAIAVAFGALTGALSARTEGIYTIMITLAIAAAFFYSDAAKLADLQRFRRVHDNSGADRLWRQLEGSDPALLSHLVFRGAELRRGRLCLARAVRLGAAGRARQSAPHGGDRLQRHCPPHRSHAFAALIASIGGILMVWLNNQISPGSAGIEATIDLLVIAVVGGLGHPIGAFVGAIIYVILRTFALDALVAVGLDGRRFQTLIGLGFLVIVLFSPDGVIGLWRRFSARALSSGGSNRK